MNRHALDGVLANLRGNVQLSAASLGGIALSYGATSLSRDPLDSRAGSLSSSMASATGGLVLAPGDATVNPEYARRSGAGRGGGSRPRGAVVPTLSRYDGPAGAGGGISWFTLWTGRSAIDLHSAGGNLTPGSAATEIDGSGIATGWTSRPRTDAISIRPSCAPWRRAACTTASRRAGMSHRYDASLYGIVLMPSDRGGWNCWRPARFTPAAIRSRRPARPRALATPQRPALPGSRSTGSVPATSPWMASSRRRGACRCSPSASTAWRRSPRRASRCASMPGRIWSACAAALSTYGHHARTPRATARSGSGRRAGACWPDAISSTAAAPGQDMFLPGDLSRNAGGGYAGTASGNLFVHASLSDVSLVQAGRDILHSSFMVAGPGVMEISAGRNLLMEDKASVVSLGPVAPGDTRAGRRRAAGRRRRARGGLCGFPRALSRRQDRRSGASAARSGPALQDLRGRAAAVADPALATPATRPRRVPLRGAAGGTAARLCPAGLFRRAAQ